MKTTLLLPLFALCSLLAHAERSDSTGRFGIAVNSSFNGELYPIRIVPSVTYTKGHSQVELGFGMNPVSRYSQKLWSSEFNYKYYPNGMHNKYNMYLVSRFSYVNSSRITYYQSTYHYLFANAGYGFEIRPFKNAFIGTNVSVGAFTYSKNSNIPNESFAKKSFLDEIGFDLAFQFNVGYRF